MSPAEITYAKVSEVVPDPDEYSASRLVSPVSSSSTGVPVTVTAVRKLTWIEIVEPTL